MKRPWLVVAAGFGLNFALGSIYAWSVFSKQFTDPLAQGGFGWSKTEATLPYTTAIVCLALVMAPAGRWQDRYGPRWVATAGALLAAVGLIVASWSSPDRLFPAVIGFGLLTGTGIGLGYAAATPAAVKRFPPERKGLVTGVVVAGFGLAPVYIAPLTHYLLDAYGLAVSFRVLGIIVLVTATALAQLLGSGSDEPWARTRPADEGWQKVLGDPNFYSLYFQFAAFSVAGLMIIGHLARIAAMQSAESTQLGFMLVAILAIFNALGRVLAGRASDWIGCNFTIAATAIVQAVNLLLFSHYTSPAVFVIGAALSGGSYGACASLFAAASADCWGLRNFGRNYGLLFTSWGIGGVAGPLVAGYIADVTGSYALAYKIAAALLVGSASLALLRQAGIPLAPFEKNVITL